MFDFRHYLQPVWPDRLCPEGEGGLEKESFAEWWARHSHELGHLDPLIAEQWVHRHWFNSDFAFLPLDSLTWRRVSMTGEEVLATVMRELDEELDPEFDFNVFQGPRGAEKSRTARALDGGTWDYPIVVLETPSGWLSRRGEYPDVRLVLVKGHQRHRYLNALHALGKAPKEPHAVFVISSPLVA